MSVYKRTIVSKDGKKSLYWYVEVGLPGGKKIKKSIGKVGEMTKAVAREVEQELKRKVKLGQWDMLQAEIPTFNEFIPKFTSYVRDIKQNRAWKDAKDCVENFAKLFGHKKLSEINSSDIEDYKRIRTQEGRKPATLNKDLAFVRHLFNYAKRCKKFYGDNPVSIAGLLSVNNQKTRVVTPEEALLLANAEEPLKTMIQIALLTGLRLNSIRTLKWSCVDLNTNTMTLQATYSKNKRTNVMPISKVFRKILVAAKLKSGDSEYVLPGAAVLPKNTISTRFGRLCKKLGIHGVRFHDLRHTAATRMIESGIGIVAVSKILGHSDIKMTMRYAHPDNSLREAVETLANFTNATPNSTTTGNLRDVN